MTDDNERKLVSSDNLKPIARDVSSFPRAFRNRAYRSEDIDRWKRLPNPRRRRESQTQTYTRPPSYSRSISAMDVLRPTEFGAEQASTPAEE